MLKPDLMRAAQPGLVGSLSRMLLGDDTLFVVRPAPNGLRGVEVIQVLDPRG